MPKLKSAAIVTIVRAADMTPRGRKNIVAWLRRQAQFLETAYAELSPRYTARWVSKAYK